MTSGAHDDTTIALATWATGLRRDVIPAAAAQALVWHHLDSVGCAVGAIDAPLCRPGCAEHPGPDVRRAPRAQARILVPEDRMPAVSAPLSSIQVGDISITYLPDGVHHVRPLAQYDGADEAFWASRGHVLDSDGWMVMSIGSLLVRNGDTNALIDLGFGPHSVDIADLTAGTHEGDLVGGDLLRSLAAINLTPADIDAVLFTHLHPDHVGWVDIDDEPTFTNASYFVGAKEWDYWRCGPEAGTPRAPTPTQQAQLAKRISLMADLETPVPGITAVATPGHTPGHLSFVVSSGPARAVILGDMIHCPVEIGQSELDFVFDVDPKLNRETKARIERELTQPDTVTVGPHFPNLVFGRVLPGSAPLSIDFSLSRILA
jgi:glyoxylase-like metal-dependent hydrolase (beta-lactamase superfamily II)